MDDYDVSSIFKDMEDYLISSMSRNMRRHTNWEEDEGFSWKMWQAKQLEALNDYRNSNTRYVNKQSVIIRLKIDELLKQSNAHGRMDQEIKILEAIKKGFKPGRLPTGVKESFFRINEQKLNALIKSVDSDINKASKAMLRMANDEYRKTIFKAQVFANTGTITTDQAIDMATKDFLSGGINCIEYRNGRRVNIASYAEMAIKTANQRAYFQGEGSKRAEWGIHTVLVSRYGACSETCLPHQGKVYIDDVWSGGTAEEVEALGLPLLSVAIAGGLFHPNCKHTMSTYFEGITTIPSKADVKGTRENSNLIATQRYNERQIRMYKRLENGSLDSTNKTRYYNKVNEWQGKQKELISSHPEMHRNYKRESLRGLNSVDTAVENLKGMTESDALDIPRFASKERGDLLKPVTHNTDAEVDNYLKLVDVKTDNEKVLNIIRHDMKLMPKRDLVLFEKYKLEIREQKDGPSRYRKSKSKLGVAKNAISLNENAKPGTFAHEFAHFAIDKQDIYSDNEFENIIKNSVKNSSLRTIKRGDKKYIRVKSDKFVNEYQGRTYITVDDFENLKVLDFSDLKEFGSVGYEYFIMQPNILYNTNIELYDFFNKRGLLNEKK